MLKHHFICTIKLVKYNCNSSLKGYLRIISLVKLSEKSLKNLSIVNDRITNLLKTWIKKKKKLMKIRNILFIIISLLKFIFFFINITFTCLIDI